MSQKSTKKNVTLKKEKVPTATSGKKQVKVKTGVKTKGGKSKVWVEKKTKKRIDTLVFPPQTINVTDNVPVRSQWNPAAFSEMRAAFTAYLLARGLSNSQEGDFDYQKFYDGIDYMFSQMANEIAGEPGLEERLRIVHDLINAFKPKEVNYHGWSKIAYAWDNLVYIAGGVFATGWNNYTCQIPDVDNGEYNSSSVQYTSVDNSRASYASLLGLVEGIANDRAKELSLVSPDSLSPLKGDASAHAKVYSYNGLTPSNSGGAYNSYELEVGVPAPILAHNCIYNTTLQDDRVPSVLGKNSGGPSFNLAPLIKGFNSWFNKVPFAIKQIDFWEIATTLIYWYMEAAQAQSSVSGAELITLPFTLQDFTIALRQALLASVFRDQWMVMFSGYLDYNNAPNSNVFVPFQVQGNTFGNDCFKTFYVNPLVRENLSLLQTQCLENIAPTSKINKKFFIPVLGAYNKDEPPTFQWTGGEGPIPVFLTPQQAVPVQSSISLVDGSIGSQQWVNLNGSYYEKVLETWNQRMTDLNTVTDLTTIGNMAPPHMLLMQATRIVKKTPPIDGPRMLGATKFEFPSLKYIANVRYNLNRDKVLTKQSSKTQIVSVPPATITELTFSAFTCLAPPPKEVYDAMRFFVLPSVRLDPQSSTDKLNQSMYQIEVCEGCSQPLNPKASAPEYSSRCLNAAQFAINGFAKDGGSDLKKVLDSLNQYGRGGALASLLGGVIKGIIPNSAGIVDTIASIVPF